MSERAKEFIDAWVEKNITNATGPYDLVIRKPNGVVDISSRNLPGWLARGAGEKLKKLKPEFGITVLKDGKHFREIAHA